MGSEWQLVRLDAVASFRNGAGVKQEYFCDNGVPLARVSDFTHNSIDLSDCNQVDFDHAEKWRSHFLKTGDVVVATVCSWPPNWSSVVGKVVRVPDAAVGAIQNQNTCCVIPAAEHVHQEFLYYRLKLEDFAWHAANSAGGSANQARLPVKKLGSFEFLLPSLYEQRQIASILKSLDDKIELNRQINTTLESMAQVLFKSWFVDFDPVIDNALAAGNPIPDALQARARARQEMRSAASASAQYLPTEIQQLFPSSFVFTEEMGWIPEGWETKSFGEHIETTIGGDWGKEEPDEKHTRKVAIIRGTDIPSVKSGDKGAVPFRWVEEKKFKTRELLDGDIVIEVSGGSPKQPTGRSAYITKDSLDLLEGDLVAASFCRKLRPTTKEVGLILALHLEHIYAQGKMWNYQNQSTGISNFQTKVFLEAELVVTPDSDALSSVFFDRVRPLIDKSRSSQSMQLAEIRDALLPKLLSGQLQVPEAEHQLAEVI